MNRAAEQHLAKAESYLAKGDGWYAKAADEIIAAQEADPTLSNREIGERFARGGDWVARLVRWRTNDADRGAAPNAFDSGDRPLRAAKQVLRDAPIEEVEKIVASLPPARVAKVARTALARPGVPREMAKDAESAASLRRASNEATEAMVRQNKERTRKARTPLAGTVNDLGALVEIIGPITAAKAKLNDAYGAAREYDLSDDHVEAVLEELGEIEQIIDWFRSYLDSGDQSFEDELQKLLADS